MAKEQEIESGLTAAAAGATGGIACPVIMNYFDRGPACGRPLHNAPEGVDAVPVCLMHSNDPGKQTAALFGEFWSQFEKILDDAKDGYARCERFIFPRLDLRGRTFQANCQLVKATFTQDADFSNTTFANEADFAGATFIQSAVFSNAVFSKGAIFSGAIFVQRADFRKTAFQDAHFLAATFTQDAYFREAVFARDANLLGATFTLVADFYKATFSQDAAFSGATFTQKAIFTDATFLRTATWRSRFLEGAEFRRTAFAAQVEGEPSANFGLATFAKPAEIVFDDVDLSRALFHNCDVSEVWFTSSVRWGRRHSGGRGSHGAMVFEETIPLDQEHAKGLIRNGERDYRAIAQIYQQLKKNYDARLDYWTANEFHFGEMEMQRLAPRPPGRLFGLRRWRYRRLSLIALYRWGSDYGNSYGKPMAWLLASLLLFAGLFPLPRVGLERSGANYRETYSSVWRAGNSAKERLRWEAGLVGKSLLTAVDTATFQKSPEYAPAYPWGRVLAIGEALLTSTLFALFLLAIRRQFRR